YGDHRVLHSTSLRQRQFCIRDSLIIVDHKTPMDVLLYSAAILLLVITLWLCNSNRLRRE
ncbi:hypothetical protein C9F07_04655, partial [Salmonella enterica subsp. enterica serovar Poona]